MELPERIYLGRLLDKYYDDAEARSKYNKYFEDGRHHFGLPKVGFNKATIQTMIQNVKSSCHSVKYDVIKLNGEDALVMKRAHRQRIDNLYTRQVMAEEDSYDILAETHRKINHLDYTFMARELKRSWTFPIGYGRVLVTSCNVCRMIRNMQIIRTLDIKEARKEWCVRVLDIRAELSYIISPKYVLICEDVESEFVILRPLNVIKIGALADKLMKVFFDFGAPLKLSATQSFREEFLEPATRMIREKRPHFELSTDSKCSETVVQNRDVIDALTSWIEEVKNSKYEIDYEVGCHVVQRNLNNKLRVTYAEDDKVFYKAFIPYNLFIKKELDFNLVDTESIVRVKGGDEVIEDPKTLWRVVKDKKTTLKRKIAE